MKSDSSELKLVESSVIVKSTSSVKLGPNSSVFKESSIFNEVSNFSKMGEKLKFYGLYPEQLCLHNSKVC